MRLIICLLLALLAAGPAWAQTLPGAKLCQEVDQFSLYNPDEPGVPFSTPPYVALTITGPLKRLARRTSPTRQEVPLTSNQVACLEALTGFRLTAVRTGVRSRFKLQTPEGTLLLFHVSDLVGSEVIIQTQVERLMANADRFLKEGNQAEAARAYQKVLEADPSPIEAAVAHTALGRMDKEAGLLEEALFQFAEAMKASPRYLPALEERATLAHDLGLQEESRIANEALLELVPNRPGPYVALIQLADKRGDEEEMGRLFRRLQAVDQRAAATLAYEMPSLLYLKSERKQAPTVKDVLEIPLESTPGGTLMAEVAVNGSNPMTFIVDTGASLVSLKSATAESLGIEMDPKRQAVIRTAKGMRTASLITIDRIEIKGIEAKNVQGVILDENLGPGVEGLLGQSFLNEINARIDVKKKVMVIE